MLKFWRAYKVTRGYPLFDQLTHRVVCSDRMIGLSHSKHYDYSNSKTRWDYEDKIGHQTPQNVDPRKSKRTSLEHKDQLLMPWRDILFSHAEIPKPETLLRLIHEIDKDDQLIVYSHILKLSKLCKFNDSEQREFGSSFQNKVFSKIGEMPRSEQLAWNFELNLPMENVHIPAADTSTRDKEFFLQAIKEYYFHSKLDPEEIKHYMKCVFPALPPGFELFKHVIKIQQISERFGYGFDSELIHNILERPLAAMPIDQVFELYNIIQQLPIEAVETNTIALIEKCLLQDALSFALSPISSKSILSLDYEKQLLILIANIAQIRDFHSLYNQFIEEYLDYLIQSKSLEHCQSHSQLLQVIQLLLKTAKYSLYLNVSLFEKLEEDLHELLRKNFNFKEVIETFITLQETGYLVKLRLNEELSKLIQANSQMDQSLKTKIFEFLFQLYIYTDENLLKMFDQQILSKISKNSADLLQTKIFWSCFCNYLIVGDSSTSYKKTDWLFTKISLLLIEERISAFQNFNSVLTHEMMAFPSIIYLIGTFESTFQKDWELLQTSHRINYLYAISEILAKKCPGYSDSNVAEAKDLKHNPNHLYLNKSLHIKEALNLFKFSLQQTNLTTDDLKTFEIALKILEFYKDNKSLNTIANQIISNIAVKNYSFDVIYHTLVCHSAAFAEFLPSILKDNKNAAQRIVNTIINSASILSHSPKKPVFSATKRYQEVLESLMFALSAGLINSETFDAIVLKANPLNIPLSLMRDLSKMMSKKNFSNWRIHQLITPNAFKTRSNLSLEGISWLISLPGMLEDDHEALNPLLTYLIQNRAVKMENFVSLVLLADQKRNQLIEYFFKKHLLTQKILDEFAVEALQLNYLRERGMLEADIIYSALKVIRFTPNGIYLFQEIMCPFIFNYIFLANFTEKRILEEAYELLGKVSKLKGKNQDESMLILAHKAFSVTLKKAAISPEKLLREFLKGYQIRSFEQQNELLEYLKWIVSHDNETCRYLMQKEEEILDKMIFPRDQIQNVNGLIVERFLLTSYFTFQKRNETLKQIWDYFLKATSLNEALKMVQVFRILLEKSNVLQEGDWVYLIAALELFSYNQIESCKIYRELLKLVSIPNNVNLKKYLLSLTNIMQKIYEYLPDYEKEIIQRESFQDGQSI